MKKNHTCKCDLQCSLSAGHGGGSSVKQKSANIETRIIRGTVLSFLLWSFSLLGDALASCFFAELNVIFPETIKKRRRKKKGLTCEFLFYRFLTRFPKCCQWKTPLCCCMSLNSCLEHLLDSGADPSMVNSKGYSAVHYAAYHGNKQNLELVSFPIEISDNSVKAFWVLCHR